MKWLASIANEVTDYRPSTFSHRFAGAHRVESYLGLTPGENSSSERQQRTSLTKAGAPRVRWALTQAAWSARRNRRKDPMVLWSIQVEQRRVQRVAIMALVRKLAGILYAIWRDGSTYDASRPPTDSPARTDRRVLDRGATSYSGV
jgi:hypothetical protein